MKEQPAELDTARGEPACPGLDEWNLAVLVVGSVDEVDINVLYLMRVLTGSD